jgi:hypothetical protein
MVRPLDRLGGREREIVTARRRDGYGTGAFAQLAEHEDVLRAVLDVLLPGVPPAIDLAAFVDATTGDPLGRGDRPIDSPPEPDLFRAGLDALSAVGFLGRDDHDRRHIVGRMRRGEADDELDVPAKLFIDRLLDKALAGYLAHPDTWERIGFAGPAYPQGYAWIGPAETIARHDRRRGWESM